MMDPDAMDNLQTAGVVVGGIGGLLALIPTLERLLAFPPGWQDPLLMGLVSVAALAGVGLALARERWATGGLITGVAGIVLAVLGPTAPGVLAVIGGTLLYASAQSPGPAPYDEELGTPGKETS